MDAGRPSLQDLIRGRQHSGFVGRRAQLVQYQENLRLTIEDEQRRFLFNIHGNAGVGKTYLTRQLRQIAHESGALTAYVDETFDDVTSAMTAIAEEIGRHGSRLSEFEKRAEAYRQHRYELESDPDAPDGVATFLTKTAVTIGMHAARGVPVAGGILASVNPTAAADQADRARRYLARKFRDHADIRLLLSPADELTPVFVAGLNRAVTDGQAALFFDAYERTAPILDRWLRDLYHGLYGDLPAGLVTTISGQHPLNPNLWSDYLPVIADIPLDPFTEAEARQFLSSRDILDELTTEVIVTLSGRLPMWLATLAETHPSNPGEIGDPAGDAVERFLRWEENPIRRSIAVKAALPRSLNLDTLAVLDSQVSADLFDWLCGLPFVYRQADSWKYHQVVRAAMMRLQRARSPSQWRSDHVALAEAHARWASQAAEDGHQSWSNPDFVDHRREEAYHLACADPVNNIGAVLAFAVKAAENDIVWARQAADLIAEAGQDTGSTILQRWGQRLRAGIRERDLTQYLTSVIDHAALDDAMLAIALKERARGWRLMQRYNEALTDLSRAIELAPGHAWTIAGRGQTYQAIGRHESALADFTRAIELDPEYAWAFARRGEIRLAMQQHHDALADFDHALAINPRASWAMAGRGQSYQSMGMYEEALASYSQAIELNPGFAWYFSSRGQLYQRVEQYAQAVADFSRAIEIDATYSWSFAWRGQARRSVGLYADALADFQRALELDPGAWVFAWRGQTHQAMGCRDEALADFSHALEIEPDHAYARTWLAQLENPDVDASPGPG
jgi:tetratricopeptide (TPR) repeat protein